MRINPPIAVGASVALALVALGFNRHRIEQRSQERCDVALAYAAQLADEHGRMPLFFVVDFEPDVAPPGTLDKFLASPEGRAFRDDPSVPLSRQREGLQGQRPVRDCGNLRTFLAGKHIAYGELGDRDPFAPNGLGGFELIGLSMPAVDSERGVAIFEASEVVGPLAGQGFEITMERTPSGEWRVKSKSPTWIS